MLPTYYGYKIICMIVFIFLVSAIASSPGREQRSAAVSAGLEGRALLIVFGVGIFVSGWAGYRMAQAPLVVMSWMPRVAMETRIACTVISDQACKGISDPELRFQMLNSGQIISRVSTFCRREGSCRNPQRNAELMQWYTEQYRARWDDDRGLYAKRIVAPQLDDAVKYGDCRITGDKWICNVMALTGVALFFFAIDIAAAIFLVIMLGFLTFAFISLAQRFLSAVS